MASKSKPKKSKSRKTGPARVLIECSPHRTTGGGFLRDLMDDHVKHESPPERNALATLCLCHDVYAIASQAAEEPYIGIDGKPHHHVPDYTVDAFVPGLRLEVKALSSLIHRTSLDKYAAVAMGYLNRKTPFALLVDAQLAEEPRASSVKLLFRYCSSDVPADVLTRATAALENGPISIADLRAVASLKLVDIWTLIARRHLSFDWGRSLHPEMTMVSLPDRPYGGLKLEDVLRSTRFSGLLAQLAVGRRPTDQRLLADAAAWRQSNRPLGPWSYVGGFQDTDPIRDLDEDEFIPRAARRKRNQAPGLHTNSKTYAK